MIIRELFKPFSLTRLGDLAGSVTGKTIGGKRRDIRWPKEIASFKKNVRMMNAVKTMMVSSVVLEFLAMLAGVFAIALDIDILDALLVGMFILCLVLCFILMLTTSIDIEQFEETRRIMGPLLGKDPYIDLRLAAFLTMGAMPEWLREQMTKESGPARGPAWLETRFSEEPYTVERAGLDYLGLMSRIELGGEAPSMFAGRPFPPSDHRLTSSLKDAVGEIILFLSSLPDSGEEPEDDVVEAVMDIIDHLATVDGEPFVEVARRHHEEEESREKAEYNGEVMRAVTDTKEALSVRNDEQYKAVQRAVNRLSKISRAGELAHESSDGQRAVSVSSAR